MWIDSDSAVRIYWDQVLTPCLVLQDNTPGCTKEACGFSANWADFDKEGAIIYGISGDNEGSHQRFIAKYGLKFTGLLVDAGLEFCKRMKSYGKNARGNTGLQRHTYLINPQGLVEAVWTDKCGSDKHGAAVLEKLREIKKGTSTTSPASPKKVAATKTTSTTAAAATTSPRKSTPVKKATAPKKTIQKKATPAKKK